MELGLALPHYDASYPGPGPATFERIAKYAELAESLGFFQVWVSDHFWLDLERYGGPPGRTGTPECWTTLTALAMRTSRVRLGTLVLAAGFRPPALLATMAATLDQAAGGRLDLGLGAGWNQAEFEENGLPFPRPGERLARLEQAMETLRRCSPTRAGRPGSPPRCSGPGRRCGSAARATVCSAWSRARPTAEPQLVGDAGAVPAAPAGARGHLPAGGQAGG